MKIKSAWFEDTRTMGDVMDEASLLEETSEKEVSYDYLMSLPPAERISLCEILRLDPKLTDEQKAILDEVIRETDENISSGKEKF